MNPINTKCQSMLKFECYFLQQMMLFKSLIKITKINYSNIEYDTIVSFNIHSLPANILNLRADPTIMKADIICLQETWLNKAQGFPKLTDEYHSSAIGEGQGKGVAVYIRKEWFKCLIRNPPVCKVLDFAWCMKLEFRFLDVINVYRSPNPNFLHRYPDFVRMVQSLLNPSIEKPMVVCGDFNFDYHKDL